MQKVVISPRTLSGKVTVPPSKSVAHRAIICASLAGGKSVIRNIDFSQDILATLDAVKALGAQVSVDKNTAFIDGTGMFDVPFADINCRESGSTLRFMLAVAAAGGVKTTFNGEGRLPQRTIKEILSVFRSHSVETSVDDGLPVTLSGKLTAGKYEISGNVSSQFITGLMFALPLCDGDSEICLTTALESKGYIDITVNSLKHFGVEVEETNNGWKIKGNQRYSPCDYTVEGDWSQAAFFMGASVLGASVDISGLDKNSVQGDKAGLDIFKRFGADISWHSDTLVCRPGKREAISLNASQIPDLVPIISAVAAQCDGKTVITGAQRLRIKESNRLKSMADGLCSLGIYAKETDDGLEIVGGKVNGGKVKGCNDHRIVMSFAVLAQAANGAVEIDDAQSINKSYPNFFEDYNSLGGKADVINLG